MASLNGKWIYQSFRNDSDTLPLPGVLPWSPQGEVGFMADDSGKVSGTLVFGPGVSLAITGSITPADPASRIPEGVQLTAEGTSPITGLPSVNRLCGFFVAGGDLVVGTIVVDKNDPAGQKDGTSGPFVLARSPVAVG